MWSAAAARWCLSRIIESSLYSRIDCKHRACNKRCRLWIDEILTAKVKQLVLVCLGTSLYTEETSLCKVKQVVLLCQKGSDRS